MKKTKLTAKFKSVEHAFSAASKILKTCPEHFDKLTVKGSVLTFRNTSEGLHGLTKKEVKSNMEAAVDSLSYHVSKSPGFVAVSQLK